MKNGGRLTATCRVPPASGDYLLLPDGIGVCENPQPADSKGGNKNGGRLTATCRVPPEGLEPPTC